jgi:(p)ppGpp synthase/HD superfamily hydrolase
MMFEMKPLSDWPRLELAKQIARTIHADQPYGKDSDGNKMSYENGHLLPIIEIGADAGMDSEEDQIIFWLHDSVEDAQEALRRMFYEMIQDQFSEHVSQTVWAMTGLGENRKARNAFMYSKMSIYPRAADYKVVDRLRNMENSKANRHASKPKRLFDLYMSEDEAFRKNVLSRATNQYLIDRYNRVAQL